MATSGDRNLAIDMDRAMPGCAGCDALEDVSPQDNVVAGDVMADLDAVSRCASIRAN